jgi:Ca2+-binding RTX toxin-like protein
VPIIPIFASRRGRMRRVLIILVVSPTIMLTAAPAQAVTAYCNGQVATIVGTAASETIYGTDGDDVISAGGGDDVVYGAPAEDTWYGGGDDLICGGLGNDTIGGGAGRDHMFGGAGNDSIVGGPHFDYLVGGGGADYLEDDESGGIDDIGYGSYSTGGPGPDRILTGMGSTTVFGGAGDDRIRVYDFFDPDTIAAGGGDDVVNSVDLNTNTFGECDQRCIQDKDIVRGGDGFDTLTHDGDWWTSFETTTECAFDPDNNWYQPCGSLDIVR